MIYCFQAWLSQIQNNSVQMRMANHFAGLVRSVCHSFRKLTVLPGFKRPLFCQKSTFTIGK